uniref:methylated-DNA--[protein]-cysteine S-methyltransferase n=1 Tax=Cyanothece sp. (strain PCC 7425 / ATCC 29141) TaxID=395961 RepID=B8HMF1_CYAP4
MDSLIGPNDLNPPEWATQPVDGLVKLTVISLAEFQPEGLKISYGIHPTPFGDCLIARTIRGICNLHFLDPVARDSAEQWLRSEWPTAEMIPDQQATQEISDRLLRPVLPNQQPFVLAVKGTDFQIQVWRALLKIPFGGLTTYGALAEAIGRPTAVRAVANAIGCNPVAYLIPCHRVIRASGQLGGFRWGLERKTALLAWEASQTVKS